jgi:hypothetical protein
MVNGEWSILIPFKLAIKALRRTKDILVDLVPWRLSGILRVAD